MAIQDDFTIFPDSKVIRHDATKSTVYSAVAFYSFLQDVFDEPGFLSYEIPIRFNTPTSFTMLNGWFLDDGDGSNVLQFLTAGGIDTLGYATISDSVLMIDLTYGTASFSSGDLDKTVRADAVSIGPLLSFKENYPDGSSARIWVRDTSGSSLSTVPGQLIDVLNGDGDYTTSLYSQIGDNIYHNLFTIAAFTGSPNPQLYVYQNHPVDSARVRLAEWSAFTNWDRDASGIDILVTTQLGGNLIDGGNITTFVRQTADTFTFVESTLTTSGRTPVATETAADEVNITEGEFYLLYESSDSGSFTAGDVITDVPLGTIDTDLQAPTWYAEVAVVTEFADTTTGILEIRSVRGNIPNEVNIYVGSTLEGVTNGTPGDTRFIWDTEPDPPDDTSVGTVATGLGGTTPKRVVRGFDLGENYLILQDDPTGITGTNRDDYYKDFSAAEQVTANNMDVTLTAAASTTLISGFNDVTVSHINGTIIVAVGSVFTLGERVTWNSGASEAIFIQDNSNTITLGNVTALDEPDSSDTILGDISASGQAASTDFAATRKNLESFNFSLQSAFNYAVFIEGGTIYNAGRSLTDIYAYLQYYLRDGQSIADRIIYTSDGDVTTETAAEEYIKARATYIATKAAPYGTLAGGVFFGAQGVWLEGMAAADNNNIKLTDDTGVLRESFTAVTITVSNTRADDRVAIFLESGTTELPNKTQYTSHATLNTLGRGFFDQNAASPGPGFPNDTPTSGTFVVVDNQVNKQHRYTFASFVNTGGSGDDGIFTLTTEITGTSDGVTASQTLEDDGFSFTGAGVIIGDIIHKTSGTLGFAYVTGNSTSRGDADTDVIQTTLLEDTHTTIVAATTWTSGDTYALYSLVKTYDGFDTFFIPYMDEIEDTGTDGSPGSIAVSLTFVVDREIILEVRNVEAATEIVPFKTTGQITSTGYTQGVIRNEDTVFTP